MKTLKFEGSSDDTFGEYGVTQDDYDNCGSGKPIQVLVQSSEGELLVVGQYATSHIDGCWVIGVSMTAEDVWIPDWPIRVHSKGAAYSPILEIDVPDDVTLSWFSDRVPVKGE